MNNHLKLRELGFKKVPIHKPSRSLTGPAMVLDNIVISYGIDIKTGRNIKIENKKIHNKADSFWELNYNEQYTIWISIIRNKISVIWLEDKSIDGMKSTNYYYTLRPDLTVLYDNSFTPRIKGTNEIINLFPNSMKRDFILNKLFKSS